MSYIFINNLTLNYKKYAIHLISLVVYNEFTARYSCTLIICVESSATVINSPEILSFRFLNFLHNWYILMWILLATVIKHNGNVMKSSCNYFLLCINPFPGVIGLTNAEVCDCKMSRWASEASLRRFDAWNKKPSALLRVVVEIHQEVCLPRKPRFDRAC